MQNGNSVTILGLRVVTPAGLDWLNGTSPSKRVGLGSPLAACSMYGDLTSSVHTVNHFHCCVIIKRMYFFVFEDHMLDWHSCQIRDLFHVFFNNVKIIVRFLIYKPGIKVLLDIML